MTRLRDFVPLPHVLVQPEYADHIDTSQWIGHGPRFRQSRLEVRAPHPTPPSNGSLITERERVWVPVPQVAVHSPYVPQSEISQSKGQAVTPHVTTASSEGQPRPPFACCTSTVRERDLEPTPHVLVQVLHEAQEVTVQWTGQSGRLGHARSSVSPPAVAPPWRADEVTLRARCCTPVPQLVLQLPHVPHCETTALIGHSIVPQVDTSSLCEQAEPPNLGCSAMLRLRDCTPVPHVLVHVAHVVHCVMAQCTGQLTSVQSRTSLSATSSPPFVAAAETGRERLCVPAPHVTEQVPQEPHGPGMRLVGQL
jgi:hypothetical protein